MLQSIKAFFSPPTLEQLIKTELYLAQRRLLEYETASEFAKSEVDFNKVRIARLKAHLAMLNSNGTTS